MRSQECALSEVWASPLLAFAEADEAAGGAAEVAVLPLPALLPPLFWLLPPLAGKAGALGGVGALGNCGWPVRTPLLKSCRIDRRWVRTLLNSVCWRHSPLATPGRRPGGGREGLRRSVRTSWLQRMYERRREASFGKCGETENWDGDLPLCDWLALTGMDCRRRGTYKRTEPGSSAASEEGGWEGRGMREGFSRNGGLYVGRD